MIPKKDNYITPKGYQKLVDELNHLMLTERPEIIKVIQWAASLGDRSENADYLYGKKRLREIDKRARFLRSRIDKAAIIDPGQMNAKEIKFGATVEVLDEDEKRLIYTIVGQDEIDTKCLKISWKSPIGSALIGKSKGDIVEIHTPNGIKELEIVDFFYRTIE